jgi:fido (protein-threonine AMPylation protein)
VPIAKGNSFFARPEHIRAELQKLFHQLAGEQYLRGNDSKGFCQRAAHYLGEINALHPFREGNGSNATTAPLINATLPSNFLICSYPIWML